MAFNQIGFIFAYLPIFLALFYAFPQFRRLWILGGSVLFYAIGVRNHPWFAAVMVFCLVFSWYIALHVRGSKPLLITGIAVIFGVLAFFKYNGLLGLNLLLPLAISFYSFQMVAYIVDVYRKETRPDKNFWNYAATMLFFPKLLSGPLMEHKAIRRQLHFGKCSLNDLDEGIREFIVGLGLKVLLADRIGGLWAQIGNLGYESISSPLAWEGILAYSLQLYFDFAGYSKMAIGVGRMLGFELPENFDHPYASRSIREFWRRWHITLGKWFQKYIYIPLGGSRNGTFRFVLSTMAVWLFTGIWHGSTFNYVFWGLLLGGLILLERYWLGEILERQRILSHVYVLLFTGFSWLLFALPNLKTVGIYLTRLFAFGASAADFTRYGKQHILLLLVGILFASPWPAKLWAKVRSTVVGTIILFVLFWACMYCISISTNDPFMYFSF